MSIQKNNTPQSQPAKPAYDDSTARDDLRVIQLIDQELSAKFDLHHVLMLTLDWALRRTNASGGMYCSLTEDGRGLVPEATMGYPPSTIPYNEARPSNINEGIAGRAARSGQTLVVQDISKDPDYVPYVTDAVAVLVVPLKVNKRLVGVIRLENTDPFTPEQIAFAEKLAARAAVWVDHANLYRAAETRADEMSSLYAASQLIASTLDQDKVMAHAAQAMASLLRVPFVVILDYRMRTQQLLVLNTYQLPTLSVACGSMPHKGELFDLDAVPELYEGARSLQITALRCAANTPEISESAHEFMDQYGWKSAMLVPLATTTADNSTKRTLLAAAILAECRNDRIFSTSELQLLEALSAQISSSLHQARLYNEVKDLENLKSEMIRLASHDLRNPLGNVMGYTFMLGESLRNLGRLDAEHEEYITYIERSLKMMRSLIEDLLTLERVESELQTSWIEVDMVGLVEHVVAESQSAAVAKRQNLNLQMRGERMRVLGSIAQLRQMVVNFVGNAIKYTPDNGVINVRLRRDQKKIYFEVQDNGYGIPKARQDRIFQRFYRAQTPGTEHINGTGLGLSLVKSVVERHGGEVWMQSEEGKGSTFGAWLPLSISVKERLQRSYKLAQNGKKPN
jgi:signal transduction histidine kinase